MLYTYETGVGCYCPKEPNSLFMEIRSNVNFAVKAEKMFSDCTARKELLLVTLIQGSFIF